jgi:hypothetical protein
LTAGLSKAFEAYRGRNDEDKLPEHIIIYRDGVGDAMRKQVLKTEIPQFRLAIDQAYNKAV